ncbi:MAG: malate dehydrogenase [Candidatus Omnitrophota bacterium]
MTRPKVSVIGAGQVGAAVAQRIIEENLADVVLTDVVEGLPQGKALDLMEAAPLKGHDAKIFGTNDYAHIRDSAIVVVTAGVPRKPGMDRMDLLKINAKIIQEVSGKIRAYAPEAILIMVTNPLDVMTALAHRTCGFPKKRVLGMAGVLDSARFRYFIAEKLNARLGDVEAMVLGGHGDDMVPLPEFATVKGVSITNLLKPEEIETLVERTRKGGAEIVALLKQGSAYYAPGASAAEMVRSILCDEKRVLPCSALLEGEYGLKEVFCGVPCRLAREGFLEIVQLPLTDGEKKALFASCESVRKGLEELSAILSS